MRSERTKLRLVTIEDTPPHDARSLSKLDWAAVALLAGVFLLAPLVAATFPTPPQLPALAPVELYDYVTAVGAPLLLGMVAVACGITLWREWKKPVAIGGISGLSLASLVIGVWATLSFVRAPALGQSLNALAVLLASLLLGGLVSRLSRDRNGFAALLIAVALGGSIIAGIGVNEFLAKWKAHDPQLRSFATFFNPNFLAGYLLLTLPVTLGAFAAAEERLARLALGIGLALQSACLLLTASRAGAGMGLLAVVVWLALAAYSGALKGRIKQAGVGLAIFIVSAGLASAPTLSRVAAGAAPAANTAANAAGGSVESQSHSGAYRRLTWTGSVKMMTANPILGAGIGSYDVTYPRYTLAAPTAHAHNSFLQWGGETGIVGLLALLVALASVTAFAAYVLRLQRMSQQDEDEEEFPAAKKQAASPASQEPLFGAPALILCGLLASVFASMLHSLFDSDWYVVCSVLTLSGIVGLTAASSRDLAPLATQRPAPLPKAAFGIGLLVAVFLFWRAGATGVARKAMVDANGQIVTGTGTLSNLTNTLEGAASADPFDPNPYLQLALLPNEPADTRKYLETAANIAPTGKTYYRLGRFLAQRDDLNGAVAAFQKAREAEPKNVQNLRQLAETLQKAGQTAEAVIHYQTINDLERSAYGQVRAVPEIVETEFAYAHLRLAEIAAAKGDFKEAVTEFERAVAVFREYWQRRNAAENLVRGEAKRKELADDYERALTGWQDALKKTGQTAEIAPIAEELTRIQTERAEDEKAAQQTEQSE